jgi:AcrR family transcriptional regulator
MTESLTREKLRVACENLLSAAQHPDEVTVRAITQRAGTNLASVNYHFGSLQQLIFSVAERVYLRLNAERLALLRQAIERYLPDPPRLVGPSIRWSLDPLSSYSVLHHMTTIAQSSDNPEVFRPMIEDVAHHRQFVPQFQRVAPWLSDVEIGFRISCLLGVRSQMTRSRPRTDELTGHQLDLTDADVVLAHVVAATAPMFKVPPSGVSYSVPNSSRH